MKRSATLALKLAVSVVLLGYLFSTTDLAALERRLRGGDILLLALAMGLYALILLLSIWRWHLLLHAQGYRAPLGHLSASYLVATFFNNFLPSNIGGDVIRVRDSSRLTGCTTTSLAVVAIDRIIGLGALYLLALGAFVAGGPPLRGLAGARLILVLLGAVFVALAYVFFRPGTARRIVAACGLGRFPWAQEQFEVVQAAVHAYRAEVGTVWLAFLASVALQAVVVFYFYVVALSLRIPLPLGAAFLIVPLCSLVQTVPISFNGWGLRESVYILYFSQVGRELGGIYREGLGRDSALAFSLVGTALVVLLSLSGAVVWTTRGTPAEAGEEPAPGGAGE